MTKSVIVTLAELACNVLEDGQNGRVAVERESWLSAQHTTPSRMSAPRTYSRGQSARQAIPAAATARTTPLRPIESRSKQPEFKSAAAKSGQSGERTRGRLEQSKVLNKAIYGSYSQATRSFG